MRRSSRHEDDAYDIALAQERDAKGGAVAPDFLSSTPFILSVGEHVGDVNHLALERGSPRDAAAIDGDGTVTELPSVVAPELPGSLTEVSAIADDGRSVRSWLALPHGDTPAPLVLWVHGGPLASWNSWHWRWNPWLLVAKGYAVLMPDPALSTGYGQDFIQRGWGAWGFAPYTDLIAATDVACALAGGLGLAATVEAPTGPAGAPTD